MNCDLDALLELVADGHRRQTIQYLRQEANGTTSIDDLLDRIHTDDSRTPDHPTDRERLAIQLYHAHLPKLADQGVVEFDPENRAVRYQPNEAFEKVLDSVSDELSLASP
jgi:hypothetical protein